MKRFIDTNDGIYDNQEKRMYKISAYEFFECETDEVVDKLNEYENKCNKFLNEIQRLNKVIDLMEYQMKVQDRIIKEYEDGD